MSEIYIDGSPALGKICLVIDDDIYVENPPFECHTNNDYEYAALFRALTISTDATIYTDSQLVERQMKGIYKVEQMRIHYDKCQSVKLKQNILWISRRKNKAGLYIESILKNRN